MFLGVFVKKNETSFDKFITQLVTLNYPPNKIQIFLYKQVTLHSSATQFYFKETRLQEELLTNISEKYLNHYVHVKTVHHVIEETAKEMAVLVLDAIKFDLIHLHFLHVEMSF